MTRSSKILGAALLLLTAMPMQQAEAWWGGNPWYGRGYDDAYRYDPAYLLGPPQMKQYIRDLYRYGPDYAAWREYRRHPYGYGYWW